MGMGGDWDGDSGIFVVGGGFGLWLVSCMVCFRLLDWDLDWDSGFGFGFWVFGLAWMGMGMPEGMGIPDTCGLLYILCIDKHTQKSIKSYT